MTKNWTEELIKISKLLPNSAANLNRLIKLLDNDHKPRVAVFGKYNHGKSTLLNALIGEERFKAADKRETRKLSEFEHNDTVFIDTPGLDADVHGEDDRLAMIAALEKADILCLVHNCKAGELDRNEMKLYKRMLHQDTTYHRKLVLILTQIDQVNSEEMKNVEKKIWEQLPALKILPVSALRFIRGSTEGKEGFIKASGLPEFKEYLEMLKSHISTLRIKEGQSLIRKARLELISEQEHRQRALDSALYKQKTHHLTFKQDVAGTIEKNTQYALELGLV